MKMYCDHHESAATLGYGHMVDIYNDDETLQAIFIARKHSKTCNSSLVVLNKNIFNKYNDLIHCKGRPVFTSEANTQSEFVWFGQVTGLGTECQTPQEGPLSLTAAWGKEGLLLELS